MKIKWTAQMEKECADDWAFEIDKILALGLPNELHKQVVEFKRKQLRSAVESLHHMEKEP